MSTRWGTCHFTTFQAAQRYYNSQGFSMYAAGLEVKSKLADGAIALGKPPERPGAVIGIIKSEGRYYYEETPKPA